MNANPRRFRYSIRMLLAVVTLAGLLVYHFVLPTLQAHRFARLLNSGKSEYGACDATVQPATAAQLLTGRRQVEAKAQLGLGFRRLQFDVSLTGRSLVSEEVPVEQWMWGLRPQLSAR